MVCTKILDLKGLEIAVNEYVYEYPYLTVLQGCKIAQTFAVLTGNLGVFNVKNVWCGMVCSREVS